jgi:NADH:ubiquinone oxidoreductase subunit F (NADH-binding)/NADH:ubiquinone oxidoreductase subunit E/Pyruvate/2-oxoacid:ferredoxin oxidoreductase delta subunit
MPIDLTFVDETVARVGREPAAVIPVLQAMQEHYGYLPEEALRRVAETTRITPAALSGVASFYDMFRHQPTGKHIVRVCTGTACHVTGAERVQDALRRHLHIKPGEDTDPDGQFTIEPVACLGCCTLAPVVKVGEHTHGHCTTENAPGMVREFLSRTSNGGARSTEELVAPGKAVAEIKIGLGSCCMAKGSDRLYHALADSVARTGAEVVVKRVGCVGMCHRTPMIEVNAPGQVKAFYAGLDASQAQGLVLRHFQPHGLWGRATRLWTRALDALLVDEAGEQVASCAMDVKRPEVSAFLGKQVHIATEHFGKIDPLDLDEYVANGGFSALAKCLGIEWEARPHPGPLPQERGNRSPVLEAAKVGVGSMGSGENAEGRGRFPLPGGEGQGEGGREHKLERRMAAIAESQSGLTSAATHHQIISAIEQSGLRGRGGAGFPTGQKWRVVAQQTAEMKYVICNGDEGDPGAFMDRMLLESFPYRVIEGMALAALAVGAHEGIFYIRHEYPLAVKRVRAAIKLMRKRGWLGERLLGVGQPLAPALSPSDGERVADRPGEGNTGGYSFKLSVFEGAGAFVCGEETALIASIQGERGMPKLRPPFPAQEGLWGKPTLINNVETLAMVPWILRNGPEKFAALGTKASKGTKVFALAGNVARGGLIEIPMGTTIREIVEDIGGGVGVGRRFKAVQIGGPSGGCVPARLADTPVDFESLRDIGAIIGSGGLVVLDDKTCMVDIARYFLQFTQNQSCGKCTFCRIGTRRMLDILERLCAGKGSRGDLETLETLARQVGAGSLCGLGKTAPNPVLTTLRYFRDEYEAHIAGRCPAGKCTALIHYRINDRCTGCTLCAQACPVEAIPMTPYARHAIDDAKCTRCDSCRQVCPHEAVEVK